MKKNAFMCTVGGAQVPLVKRIQSGSDLLYPFKRSQLYSTQAVPLIPKKTRSWVEDLLEPRLSQSVKWWNSSCPQFCSKGLSTLMSHWICGPSFQRADVSLDFPFCCLCSACEILKASPLRLRSHQETEAR